jgi:hypothetical protein
MTQAKSLNVAIPAGSATPTRPLTTASVHAYPPVEADDGSRTRDLWLGKPTLYQLSYVRVERDSTARLRATRPGFGGASAARMGNGGQPAAVHRAEETGDTDL